MRRQPRNDFYFESEPCDASNLSPLVLFIMGHSEGTNPSFKGPGPGREAGCPASAFPGLCEGQRGLIQAPLPPQRPLTKANTGFL